MRFIQTAPMSRAPIQARRPINPRSLHRRPQYRPNSNSAKNGPKNPAENSNLENPQSQPHAVAPQSVPAGAVVPSRGLRNAIMAGPVGKFGRWYGRAQERKPYTTQLWSSVIIYLCGDLSAQLLFPAEVSAPGKEGEEESEEEGETVTAGYDPYRTLRHLCVGVGSSIPSYKW